MKKLIALSVCALFPVMAPVAFSQTQSPNSTQPNSTQQAQPNASDATGNASHPGTSNGTGTSGTDAASGSQAGQAGTQGAGAPGTTGAAGAMGTTGAQGSGATNSGAANMNQNHSGAADTANARGGSAATTGGPNGAAVKEDLVGETVYNEDGDDIGTVQDVVVDSNGKAKEFVIGVGGFLGMGKHDVAIPYDKVTEQNDKLILRGYTKKQLKDMPAVK